MKQPRNLMRIATVTLLMLLLAGAGEAYSAGSPYLVTMNFIVPSDTSFTAALALSETTIDFNPAGVNSKGVQPDSQDNTTGRAMVNVTNQGNVNLNFTVNLTASQPSCVALKASSNTSYATATAFGSNTNQLILVGWNSTATSANASIFLWADFTSATGGTTARTFEINSMAS